MPETPDTPVEKPEGTPNVPVTPDTPVEKPEEAPDVSEIPGDPQMKLLIIQIVIMKLIKIQKSFLQQEMYYQIM